jgi:AdoMet-dependent rRNA methyltransferase SPB1
LTELDRSEKKPGGLSRRAAQFFDQDIFKDIGGLPEEEESDEGLEDEEEEALDKLDSIIQQDDEEESEDDLAEGPEEVDTESDDGKGFQVVKRTDAEKQWEDEAPRKDGKLGKHHTVILMGLKYLTRSRYRYHHSRSHDPGPRDCVRRENNERFN